TACASARATSAASPLTRTAVSGTVRLPDQRVQLVLEPSALDRAVDPALLRRARLPPPAARAARRACRHRARTRRAADRGVALVVERVIRDVAVADVVPDLVLRPFGERVELHDRAVVVVDLDLADVRAARPLVAAEAGDPCVEAVEVLRQRPHLAHVAAEEPEVARVVEQILAVLAGHRRDLARVRLDDLEVEARVALAQPVGELVRL